MRERDALAWLFSFADMERGVGWNPASDPSERWKLGRTRALLDLAGAPDRRMRCVLIAGTKGKGSTAAFLAALLASAGVRAGLYTQPHLQAYRERLRVDGVMVDRPTFADLVDRWRRHVATLGDRDPGAGPPTTFEITTALAIGHFAEAGCAVAVLEVGLGGRLDATNAVEPEVSIVTTVDRGHTEILGGRIEAIAREKAGILRPDRAALLAPQRPTARRALAAACRRSGARCRWVDPLPLGTALGIPGDHQRANAALAVAAAAELGVLGDARALRTVRWPGRIETLERSPRIVLDGAHDPASARALARELTLRGERSVELVVGMYRDKEATRILRPLVPLAARVWATRPKGPRALAVAALAAACRRAGPVPIEAREGLDDALDAARSAAGPGRAVVVTGSLALVGEARDHLGLRPLERLWA